MDAHVSDYQPQVCGDCKQFRRCGKRGSDATGRQPGICTVLKVPTTRTDWCHDPSNIELQNDAMARYEAYVRQKEYKNAMQKRNKRIADKGRSGGGGVIICPPVKSRRSDRGVGRTGGYTKHGDRSV